MRNLTVFGTVMTLLATSSLSFATGRDTRVTVIVQDNTPVAQAARSGTTQSVEKRKGKKKKASQKAAAAAVAVPAKKKVLAAPAPKTAQPLAAQPVAPVAPAPDSQVRAMPASPSTTVTTPIKQVQSDTTKSAWGFKYRSYNAMDLNAIENSNPKSDNELRAWDRFTLSYNINPDISFGVMPQLYHTWFGSRNRAQSDDVPGLQQPYAAYMGDTALRFVDSSLAEFKGGFVLDTAVEYFVPTSEASQKAGQIGETRGALALNKSVGKVDFKWTEQVRYFIQQYATSSLTDAKGAPLQNLNYRLLHLLDIGYNFTKKLNFTLESGFMNESRFADNNTGGAPKNVDYIIMNPELAYTFNDYFSLSAGIWEQYKSTNTPTASDGTHVASYTPLAEYNNSEGYFMTTIKF